MGKHRPPPPTKPPHQPRILYVRFRRKKGSHKMTGTVTLSPLVATNHVTSRQVVVTIQPADTTQPPVTLPGIEAITNPAQFTANEGDSCSIVDTDINAAGSTASPAFVIVATLPLTAPTQPSVLSVAFQA